MKSKKEATAQHIGMLGIAGAEASERQMEDLTKHFYCIQ